MNNGDAGREWDHARNRSVPNPSQHFHHQGSYPAHAWARKSKKASINDAAATAHALTLSRPSIFAAPSTPSLFSPGSAISPPPSPVASRSAAGAPSNPASPRPLATLAGPSSGSSRRTARFDDQITSVTSMSSMANVQKDADDPTLTSADGRKSSEGREKEYATLTALSRLFSGQMPLESGCSTSPSYYQTSGTASNARCKLFAFLAEPSIGGADVV